MLIKILKHCYLKAFQFKNGVISYFREKKIRYCDEAYLSLNNDKRDEKVIVSLTSFPARFSKLDLVIKSILLQSEKPDKVILWLGSDSSDAVIPKELERLCEYGLEIIRKREDLRSHKKYYYAMKSFPNDVIITIDDDVIYDKNLIRDLLQKHKEYPNAVVAKRVHRIKYCEDGTIDEYLKWDLQCENEVIPSMDLMATGVGGVLYPPKCMDDQVFNKDDMMKYCPKADDIWLKFMEMKKGTPVVYSPGGITPIEINGTQRVKLSDSNVVNHGNDSCIKQMEVLLSKCDCIKRR